MCISTLNNLSLVNSIVIVYEVSMAHTGFFFLGGGQGKNISHFTINKIMHILNIF
jgi:hypothetical protein